MCTRKIDSRPLDEIFQRCYRLNLKRKWEEVVRSAQGRSGEVWPQNTQQFIEGEGVRGGPRAVH